MHSSSGWAVSRRMFALGLERMVLVEEVRGWRRMLVRRETTRRGRE